MLWLSDRVERKAAMCGCFEFCMSDWSTDLCVLATCFLGLDGMFGLDLTWWGCTRYLLMQCFL
jgi:hypothetical protein